MKWLAYLRNKLIHIWLWISGGLLRKQIADLQNQLQDKETIQDSKLRFEIRADLPTKMRVWWREAKGRKFHEVEGDVIALKSEMNKIDRELEEMRPRETHHNRRQFMDYTQPIEHKGLSKTGR